MHQFLLEFGHSLTGNDSEVPDRWFNVNFRWNFDDVELNLTWIQWKRLKALKVLQDVEHAKMLTVRVLWILCNGRKTSTFEYLDCQFSDICSAIGKISHHSYSLNATYCPDLSLWNFGSFPRLKSPSKWRTLQNRTRAVSWLRLRKKLCRLYLRNERVIWGEL